jgi:hypothetical protein
MKKFFIITFALAALAACGGGGGGSLPTATTQPSPIATTQPTPAATAAAKMQLFVLTQAQAAAAVVSPPPGVSGVSALSMSFTAVGQTQYALVFEPGFSGSWNIAIGSCTSGQDVNFSSTSASGPQTVLTITASSAGDCAIQISDGTTANTAEILLDVTTTTGTISVTKRH